MFRTLLLTSAFAAFSAAGVIATTGPAMAITTDEVISDLQAQGYTSIEVKVGPTQIKAEASNGTDKLEIVYDKETGEVLKSEVYAGQGSEVDPGVEVENENKNFVDDEDDSGHSRSDDDDDDDDDHSGRDDDDHDDRDDHDDDHDDDHGGGDDD